MKCQGALQASVGEWSLSLLTLLHGVRGKTIGNWNMELMGKGRVLFLGETKKEELDKKTRAREHPIGKKEVKIILKRKCPWWQRWHHAGGLWVVLLGLDGAGKSTLIQALREELGGAFRRTETFHLMPGLLLKRGDGGPVTEPHGKPPRSVLGSLLKLAYYWLDCTLGYWVIVRPRLARSTLVFFDRYYHDLLVDRQRYRYGGPMWLARLVGRFIPKPDLYIFLDLPAEVAYARKPEVPLEEARSLRERYLELARSLPNAHVVDASRPLEEVVAEVEDIILRHLAASRKSD